jgi:hypothetical protein
LIGLEENSPDAGDTLHDRSFSDSVEPCLYRFIPGLSIRVKRISVQINWTCYLRTAQT